MTGLNQAYSFGPEFAAALAAFAVAFTGDPTTTRWSIGGPFSPGLLGGLLSDPKGISFSHNLYESDASPARVSIRTVDQSINIQNAVLIRLDRVMLT